jgi:two-component system, OmpR family, response regulator VicR
MKVLIIEDEKSIIDAVNVALEFRWPEAKLISSAAGKKGVLLAEKESPDIIILDLNLPDISGFEVLKQIREFSTTPVIILTVRSDDEDMLKGLEAGADDYVIKPFNYMTLLARIRAVLRRTETIPFSGKHDNAVNARLKIDFVNQKVKVDNRLIKLTPVEYKVLALLVKNSERVVSYKIIMREIWDKGFTGETENIRICVRRLRKKLHDNPPNLIINKHGIGYMFKS